MPAEIGAFTQNGRPYCCAYQSAATTLCHSERPYREESAVKVLAGSSPALASRTNSRCGNHLEILWEASIDGIHPAPVCL